MLILRYPKRQYWRSRLRLPNVRFRSPHSLPSFFLQAKLCQFRKGKETLKQLQNRKGNNVNQAFPNLPTISNGNKALLWCIQKWSVCIPSDVVLFFRRRALPAVEGRRLTADLVPVRLFAELGRERFGVGVLASDSASAVVVAIVVAATEMDSLEDGRFFPRLVLAWGI